MIEMQEKYMCSGCGVCENICPVKAISMCADEEGFLYPNINEKKCIGCQKCQKQCPILNTEKKQSKKDENTAYAAKTKKESVLQSSSSGGIFTEIATFILENEGVVFGAAFDNEFHVKHIGISHINDLHKLQGSKYVQSEIGNTYIEAKEYLDAGKMVLFTGTPCQIAGIYNFLNREYENLYTQDIVCHGVPSPMVWKKYIEFREQKALGKTKKIYFRNKKYGWKNYSIQFEFTNHVEYLKEFSEDIYMRGFLKNIFLRPSCYQCKFKTMTRRSDITLADFWGIEKVCPEMYDKKGTSLVMLNSQKGNEIFDLVKNSIDWSRVDFSEAAKYNSSIFMSVKKNDDREEFLKCVYEKNFQFTAKTYLRLPIKEKMKRRLIKLKNKVKELLV